VTAPVDPGIEAATAAVLAEMARSNATAEVGTPSLYAGRVVSSAATMRQNIVTQAQALIRSLWAEVNPWNGAEVERFTARAAEITVAAQRQVGLVAAESEFNQLAGLGLDYREVITVPSEVRGTRIDPDEGIVTPSRARTRRARATVTYVGDPAARDTPARESKVKITITGDPAEAYNRPARKFRFLVDGGMDERTAMDRATTQLDTITDTNAGLAARLTEAEALRRAEKAGVPILGQRRVVHPELSLGGTCALCLVASDREYKVGTLAPIHDHCKCTTSPITREHDPGGVLNAIDLEKLYDEAGGNGRDVLKRTRYVVDEHGELVTVYKPLREYKPRGQRTVERTSTTRPEVEVAPDTDAARMPYWQAPDDEVRRRIAALQAKKARRDRMYSGTMPRNVATQAASDLSALDNLTRVPPPTPTTARGNGCRRSWRGRGSAPAGSART